MCPLLYDGIPGKGMPHFRQENCTLLRQEMLFSVAQPSGKQR